MTVRRGGHKVNVADGPAVVDGEVVTTVDAHHGLVAQDAQHGPRKLRAAASERGPGLREQVVHVGGLGAREERRGVALRGVSDGGVVEELEGCVGPVAENLVEHLCAVL